MNKVESYIENKYETELRQMGFELVDIQYQKVGGQFILRIFADRLNENQRINLDDCEVISRYLSDCFDSDNQFPVQNKYILEVSSPGIERPLNKPQHYKRFIGEKIRIKFYRPLEGEKKSIGTLLEADDRGILFDRIDGVKLQLKYDEIAAANLYFEL